LIDLSAKRSKRLSPAKKHTRAFIKQRIAFYSNGFRESKNQLCNVLEEKKAAKSKSERRKLSKAEAERLEFLNYIEKQAREQADQYQKKWMEWKNKKKEFFPV